MLKLNYGCGENKLEGFVNIDIEESTKPDLICDLRSGKLPYEDNSVDTIYMIHCIEHIEVAHWDKFFNEFYRVLKPNAPLILAYPEFSKCALGFINNEQGMKDFFRLTLYGRQLYPGDYHVTPMDTFEFVSILKDYGFTNIKYGPDKNEPYNTWLKCEKGEQALTREDVIREEIFHVNDLIQDVGTVTAGVIKAS